MSVRTMAKVWEGSQHAGSDLLMLLAIADFADDAGNAYPSVATLATKCRMKPRNARYCLQNLEASGELKVALNAGPRGANRYRVMLDLLGVQHSAGVQAVAGVQPGAATPATRCREPLQRIAPEPSLNHQEPPKREQRSAPKHRIPENWMPSESMTTWAHKERPELDVNATALNFRDHYLAKGEARADWDASFRTWVRRENKPMTALNRARATSHHGLAEKDFRAGIGPNQEIL